MAGHDWESWEKLFLSRTVDSYAAHLIPHLKPNSKIIDVGCGPGNLTIDFARRVPQGHVVGVDHSERTLAVAKAAAEKAGVSNIEFVLGDAETLSKFEDNTFDIAHAHQVLLHLPRPVESLRNMRRIVKTGGAIGVRDAVYYNQLHSTPTILDNWDKTYAESRKRGAMEIGTGAVTHDWMHESGTQRENIQTGVSSLEFKKEFFPAMIQGFLGWARDRGENEEYMALLKEELEAWSQNPSARFILVDGWAVGLKH